METVLVVAAHPDDEVLGLGGTVARHALAGDQVHVLIVAEGETSRTAKREDTTDPALAALRSAAAAAALALGTLPPRFLGLPDNRLDSLDFLDVVKSIEAVVEEVEPSVVYTHWGGDLNIDHVVTHRAVATACRPLPGRRPIGSIFTFETVSSSEWSLPEQDKPFQPLRWVDVSATMDRKMAALRCYAGEMRPFPHARSFEAVEALARLRGAQSGMMLAESFGILRQLVPG